MNKQKKKLNYCKKAKNWSTAGYVDGKWKKMAYSTVKSVENVFIFM